MGKTARAAQIGGMKTARPIHMLLLTLAACPWPAAAEEPLPEVTTDTLAYCVQLHDRVETMARAATAPVSAEVASLSTEGQRMCENGLARGGVMRLRRALAIMMRPYGGE
jgi:hypothetical protein